MVGIINDALLEEKALSPPGLWVVSSRAENLNPDLPTLFLFQARLQMHFLLL